MSAISNAAARRSIGRMVVALGPKELGLLPCLIGEQGRLVSRAQLQARLWLGVEELPGKILNMHVWSLRRQLADHGQDPQAIVTVRGHGYRYDRPHRRPTSPTRGQARSGCRAAQRSALPRHLLLRSGPRWHADVQLTGRVQAAQERETTGHL